MKQNYAQISERMWNIVANSLVELHTDRLLDTLQV